MIFIFWKKLYDFYKTLLSEAMAAPWFFELNAWTYFSGHVSHARALLAHRTATRAPPNRMGPNWDPSNFFIKISLLKFLFGTLEKKILFGKTSLFFNWNSKILLKCWETHVRLVRWRTSNWFANFHPVNLWNESRGQSSKKKAEDRAGPDVFRKLAHVKYH